MNFRLLEMIACPVTSLKINAELVLSLGRAHELKFSSVLLCFCSPLGILSYMFCGGGPGSSLGWLSQGGGLWSRECPLLLRTPFPLDCFCPRHVEISGYKSTEPHGAGVTLNAQVHRPGQPNSSSCWSLLWDQLRS